MSDSSRTKENTLPSYSSGYMISEEDLAYRWGEVEALSEVDPQLAPTVQVLENELPRGRRRPCEDRRESHLCLCMHCCCKNCRR